MRNLTGKVAITAFLSLLAVSVSWAQSAWTPPGPEVGAVFPDELKLQDQSGKQQTLKALMGKNGIAVFFVRSADWCPFCKRQLIDTNAHLAEFKALGINVVSVSHDTVELIAAFHTAQNIGFPMLADPDGAVVEKIGIRNLEYADGSKAYGVARPMIFIINPKMKITHKYAEESFRNRPDLDKVLADMKSK
jgi:peroxiredoxin